MNQRVSAEGEIYEGVLYYVLGTKHAVNFIVSVSSLRQYWQGPVAVLCDEDAEPFVERAARDPRLHAQQLRVLCMDWPKVAKRNNGYANKTLLFERTPFHSSLFVDADTAFCAPPSFCARDQVALTQFANWTTQNKNTIRKRVEGWRAHAEPEVNEQLAGDYPAINTGVLAWRRGPAAEAFSAAWRQMTLRNVSFICDEIAAQLVFSQFPHVVLNDAFNWSPIHSRSPSRQAHIMHFHGKKGVKRRAGRKFWMPLYRWCLEENFAELRDWTPAGYSQLRDYEADPSVYDGPDEGVPQTDPARYQNA